MSSPFVLAGGPQARVGTVVNGKWRLERLLGLGGMAAVYAARHRNGSRAAVKMLHPDLAVHASIRERFLREAYATNAVEHPGVLRVLDDDVAPDGSVFLVMDLLEGEALDAFVARQGGKLDVETAIGMTDAILEVLAVAHERGVVHRDIKPQNVFLTRDGQLKVLDFGIAFVGAQSEHVTRTGTTMGTPAFMPAEQARGRWESVDAQSDVWAVGATLYYLLTGRLVHEAATPNETLLAAMTQSARPLQSVVPDVSPTLAAVVDKALSYEKRDRWPSARAMLDALREASIRKTEPFLQPAPAPGPAPATTTERPAPPAHRAPSERAVVRRALEAPSDESPTLEPDDERPAFLPSVEEPTASEDEAPTALQTGKAAEAAAPTGNAASSFATERLVHAPAATAPRPSRSLPRITEDEPEAGGLTVRLDPKYVVPGGLRRKPGSGQAIPAADPTPVPGILTDPSGAPPISRRLTFDAPPLPGDASSASGSTATVRTAEGSVVTAGAWGVTGVPKEPRDDKPSRKHLPVAWLSLSVAVSVLVGLGAVLFLATYWGDSSNPPSDPPSATPATSPALPRLDPPADEAAPADKAAAAETPVDAGLDASAEGGTPRPKGRPNKGPPKSIY